MAPNLHHRRLAAGLLLFLLGGGLLAACGSSGPRLPAASGTTTKTRAAACHTGDVGSGSPTDPRRYGVDLPACGERTFPITAGPLPTSGPVTAAQLSSIDPMALFWAMLKRQSTETISDQVAVDYQSAGAYAANFPGGFLAQHVEIDWTGRRAVEERFDLAPGTGALQVDDSFTRCVSPTEASLFDSFSSTWSAPNSDDTCSRLKGSTVADSHTTDGIAAGGLSDAEADRFLSYLAGVPGLFKAARPQLALGSDHRTYVVLDVDLVPQDPRDPDNATHLLLGPAFLNAAFAQTGKSVTAWPYSTDVGDAQGRHIRYYLDPTTLLPRYSVMDNLVPTDAGGKTDTSGGVTESWYLFCYQPDAPYDQAGTEAQGPATVAGYAPFPFPRPNV